LIWGVFGQRYAAAGAPLGPEFRVNSYTTAEGVTFPPRVAVDDSSGNFVVIWHNVAQSGWGFDVFGQRYASSGTPLGPEFRVNTFTSFNQGYPAVTSDAGGNFVVVWESLQDGGGYGVFGQRYASSGSPVGPEFRVNTYTTDAQYRPAVTSDAAGNFVVIWKSFQQEGSDCAVSAAECQGLPGGVFGQRYSQIVPIELMHFRVE
jgi:hypothetical protein